MASLVTSKLTVESGSVKRELLGAGSKTKAFGSKVEASGETRGTLQLQLIRLVEVRPESWTLVLPLTSHRARRA